MNAITNPLALQALTNALQAARHGPKSRNQTDSRTADKFVIRGFVELFDELSGIGAYEGRSQNAEAVSAFLDALSGHQRSRTMLKVLKMHLGVEFADRVLAEVPDFDLKACKHQRKFVVRFPEQTRAKIKAGVDEAIKSKKDGGPTSMNQWALDALVAWIKFQRQHYALLSACIAMDQSRLEAK